ncbi:hypothetical protein [Paenibacillus daejeonensis]|uniref:hypothetical protein n=1 Tax=Paenibacillus daejeonensis TaxID=135193 RepID=UPI000366896B|nr:hypothetical protein [Paenibacillus daejeonensis]
MPWYIDLWSKVETRPGYKVLFVLFMAAWGAAIGLFFTLLLLQGVDMKYKIAFILCAALIHVVLSPLQYKLWSRKYHYYLRVKS